MTLHPLRRILSALVAGAVLATCATACGGSSGAATQDADGTTTIRYQTCSA